MPVGRRLIGTGGVQPNLLAGSRRPWMTEDRTCWHAGALARTEISHDSMVRLMVGRELTQFYERKRPTDARRRSPVLEVRQLRWKAG